MEGFKFKQRVYGVGLVAGVSRIAAADRVGDVFRELCPSDDVTRFGQATDRLV